MKIGGSDRLTRAAVSLKNTEWSRTPCPSSASMFCSTAGRGPIRNILLSPKYRHTNDCGPSGKASVVVAGSLSSVIGTMLHISHFVPNARRPLVARITTGVVAGLLSDRCRPAPVGLARFAGEFNDPPDRATPRRHRCRCRGSVGVGRAAGSDPSRACSAEHSTAHPRGGLLHLR